MKSIGELSIANLEKIKASISDAVVALTDGKFSAEFSVAASKPATGMIVEVNFSALNAFGEGGSVGVELIHQ